MRLSVVHVVGYPRRLAGANRSLLALVSGYPSEVDAHAVVTAESHLAEALRERGVRVHVLPTGPELERFGRALFGLSPLEKALVLAREVAPFTARLVRLLLRLGAVVVHANDPRAILLAGPASRMVGARMIGHFRGVHPFSRSLRRVLELLPHRIVCVSDAVRNDLSPSAQGKAVTVYNAVASADATARPPPWIAWVRREALVVACFATLTPFKGCHHMIDAAAALAARGLADRFVFLWIGDMPDEHASYREALQLSIEERGVVNVTFTAWQADPFAFYAGVDVALVCSVDRERVRVGRFDVAVQGHEGLPRTALEAMSYGVPVVAGDVTGVREIVVDGETGVVVPQGDGGAIAAALEQLLGDPERRARMGEAARARAEQRFSIASCVEAMLTVYRDAE